MNHLEEVDGDQHPQSGQNLTTPQPSSVAQTPIQPETPSGQVSPSPGKSGIRSSFNITRRGKIARFPNEIREQVNRRLHNGENSSTILPWLNAIPEVRQILDSDFAGKPVRKQNISEWRKGGYREWLNCRQAADVLSRIREETLELRHEAGDNLTDNVSCWLAARYFVEAKDMDSREVLDLDVLRKFTTDISSLRRGDHIAKRLDLTERRQEDRKVFERNRLKRKIVGGVEALERFVEKNPEAKSAYQAFRAALATQKPPLSMQEMPKPTNPLLSSQLHAMK
ncbi:MAG: hypothetical protein WCD79_15540 [Chthoniobacteraceae bacterium]